MTDHKFTDEQILIYLESAAKVADCDGSNCVYKDGCDGCLEYVCKEALDLIKRQKAELEDLRKIVYMDRTEAIKKLKAEAIKEFAERLKQTVYTHSTITGYQYHVVDVSEIDNLVKEMIEGE